MIKTSSVNLFSQLLLFPFIYKTIDNAYNSLKKTDQDSVLLSESIRRERSVLREEQEERRRMGLHGDAAVEHYNEWMHRYGMDHLMVKNA